MYGLALIAELRRHGYELSPGTLYPVLHQLEGAGYLSRLLAFGVLAFWKWPPWLVVVLTAVGAEVIARS